MLDGIGGGGLVPQNLLNRDASTDSFIYYHDRGAVENWTDKHTSHYCWYSRNVGSKNERERTERQKATAPAMAAAGRQQRRTE